jgi:hypothetical protein
MSKPQVGGACEGFTTRRVDLQDIGVMTSKALPLGVPRGGRRAALHNRRRAVPVPVPMGQGLTLVHFSAQPKPFWSHLPVFPCLIDRGQIMHPT